MSDKQLYEKRSKDYSKIYPLTYMRNILDENGNNNLIDIFKCYNHIYVTYANNVSSTRLLVPEFLRKYGLWISYEKDGKLYTEAFLGSNVDAKDEYKWIADSNWEYVPDLQYIESASSRIPNQAILPEHLSNSILEMISNAGAKITNLVDEEDLTEADCHVIKLKDRKYNKALASGLGYKILRKNWVNGKNILTQDMINETNTIYEVRYDFDLDEETITIPEGCVLKFEGGNIKNGEIIFQNTILKYLNYSFDNCNFDGNIITDIINEQDFCSKLNQNVLSFIINQIGTVDIINFRNNSSIDIEVSDSTVKLYTLDNIINRHYLFAFLKDKHNTVVNFNNLNLNIIETVANETNLICFDNCSNIQINNLIINGDSSKNIVNNKTNVLTNNSNITAIKCVNNCHNLIVVVKGNKIMTILETALWQSENSEYNIYDSSINVFGINVRYPVQLTLIDNCDINIYFEDTHRGFHGSAITNSNIYVKGKNANESLCNCILRDMRWKDNSNIIHFKECSNLNVTIEDIGTDISQFIQMLAIGPYADQEIFSNRNIPYNFNNINVKLIIKKASEYNYGKPNICLIAISKANTYLNNIIDNLQLNCEYLCNDDSNIKIIYPNENYNIGYSINIKGNLYNSKINSQNTFYLKENQNLTIENINIGQLYLYINKGKLILHKSTVNSIEKSGSLTSINNEFLYVDDCTIVNFNNSEHKINKESNLFSSNKPRNPYIGFQYFDTTLNKPIWWTGTKWVDSTGSDV